MESCNSQYGKSRIVSRIVPISKRPAHLPRLVARWPSSSTAWPCFATETQVALDASATHASARVDGRIRATTELLSSRKRPLGFLVERQVKQI